MKYFCFLILMMSFVAALFAQTAIPKDTSYNVIAVYKQIHKDFPAAVPAIDSVPSGVKNARDIIYTTLPETKFGKRDLHLDIFWPEKKGKYPVLIMVHGGGWRSGNKSLQIPMAEMLAAKGFVTVTVEYQLSLEAKYPAAVYNIKSAIRWVRAHGAAYFADTSKIAISGCSAGGHLASLVGMTNGIDQFEGDQGNKGTTSKVNAVIDIDGVIDFMAPLSLNLNRKADSPDVQWLGDPFAEKPLIWKEASPGFWANESSMVPVLFINSGFPIFHAGQDELIGTMKEWGTYYEVRKFDVKMHPFWLFHPWVDQTVNYMADFLTKVYNKK